MPGYAGYRLATILFQFCKAGLRFYPGSSIQFNSSDIFLVNPLSFFFERLNTQWQEPLWSCRIWIMSSINDGQHCKADNSKTGINYWLVLAEFYFFVCNQTLKKADISFRRTAKAGLEDRLHRFFVFVYNVPGSRFRNQKLWLWIHPLGAHNKTCSKLVLNSLRIQNTVKKKA